MGAIPGPCQDSADVSPSKKWTWQSKVSKSGFKPCSVPIPITPSLLPACRDVPLSRHLGDFKVFLRLNLNSNEFNSNLETISVCFCKAKPRSPTPEVAPDSGPSPDPRPSLRAQAPCQAVGARLGA